MSNSRIRWNAVIHYRTNNGTVDVEHDLPEIEDLHAKVEAGPHWDTIEKIVILRCGAITSASLTVEQAAEL